MPTFQVTSRKLWTSSQRPSNSTRYWPFCMPKEPGIIQSLLWFLVTWFDWLLSNSICLCLLAYMWKCRSPTLPSETVTEPSASTQTPPSLISGGGRHTSNRLQLDFDGRGLISALTHQCFAADEDLSFWQVARSLGGRRSRFGDGL